MVSETKIPENRENNASKNHVFFACVFPSILEGFGVGFGRVVGGVWDLLGVSWGTFKSLFLSLCCQEGPRGSKRRPRGLLDSIWDGFGEVLGGLGRPKLSNNQDFWYFFDMLFEF